MSGMSWGGFKKILSEAGVTDEMAIESIDVEHPVQGCECCEVRVTLPDLDDGIGVEVYQNR